MPVKVLLLMLSIDILETGFIFIFGMLLLWLWQMFVFLLFVLPKANIFSLEARPHGVRNDQCAVEHRET